MAKQELRGERNWYAIHTYAGYENAVLRNLRQRIDSLGMNDKIFSVIVPTEKKIKIKGGKRVEVEEKVYPGYVLVDMIVDDNSWYVVRNTPRVTGFVGAGVNPVPLTKKKLMTYLAVWTKPRMQNTQSIWHSKKLYVSPMVRSKIWKVRFEIDQDRGKVKVLVSMFGRETPVELDFLQIKKL
jgi:transcriptional antiterminator NusG